jgi:hypothetical protein
MPSRSLPIRSVLELAVPRNSTATLQLLQRLIGREAHRSYCCGLIDSFKVPGFLEKMSARYPAILRNARGRTYDRTRGRAAMHMIVCPPIGSDPCQPLPVLQWFLVSSPGDGGLCDAKSHDCGVAHDATSASGHLTTADYVLVYGTKRQPRTVTDRRSRAERTIWHQTSTWTWRIRGEVLAEIRAAIHSCCRDLQFGADPSDGGAGWGLLGMLAAQRNRPLFAGVRNQVVDLYRFAAEEAWPPYRQSWLAAHPRLAREHGQQAGRLPSISDLTRYRLPTMPQIRMYSVPPTTIRDLLQRAPSNVVATRP